MISDAFPRFPLLDGPTPLQRMVRLEKETGHNSLWVKRDDCMPLGLGGNKLRSLEFWLGQALNEGCDTLLVAGGIASNQCRLTAAAAAKSGLDCVILYAGNEPTRYEGNLLLSSILDARLHFIGPVCEEERGSQALQMAETLRKQGKRPYLIGDPILGAMGYVEGAFELLRQAETNDITLPHVILAGSMGPTEAGFLFGARAFGWTGTLHLISVEYQAQELDARLSTILDRLSQKTRIFPFSDWRLGTCIHVDQLGGGYDQATPASLAAAKRVASREGFFAERTYMAKTFAGLFALIENGTIPSDEPVCIIHTGGNPALFSQI